MNMIKRKRQVAATPSIIDVYHDERDLIIGRIVVVVCQSCIELLSPHYLLPDPFFVSNRL